MKHLCTLLMFASLASYFMWFEGGIGINLIVVCAWLMCLAVIYDSK